MLLIKNGSSAGKLRQAQYPRRDMRIDIRGPVLVSHALSWRERSQTLLGLSGAIVVENADDDARRQYGIADRILIVRDHLTPACRLHGGFGRYLYRRHACEAAEYNADTSRLVSGIQSVFATAR
jgi:hypothetical protein